MNIEVYTQEPRIILKEFYDLPTPDIGTVSTPAENIEFTLLDNGGKNLMGATTVWLVVKILTIKLSSDAKAILLSVLANIIFEGVKKLSKPILKIDDKVVTVNKEHIELAIKAYIREKNDEEE